MAITPCYWTSVVGSTPHMDSNGLCRYLARLLDIPAWPQLTKRHFRENMYVQFSAGLPGVVLDVEAGKITFDTKQDLLPAIESFYELYLAEDLEAFALQPEYAQGFFDMLEALQEIPGEWVKGQVTGPISFGLTVTDQDLRSILYNEMLEDVIVKHTAMSGRWQARQLKKIRPNVIVSVDEPYMASFGSAFISLSRERVVEMLDEIFAAIHGEGALAGVHCCANTDWSVLLSTRVDVLSLDAYGYTENLALYPQELRAFLERGGVIAWGLVPNNEMIFKTRAGELAARLRDDFRMLAEKAKARSIDIKPEELTGRSLITPSCGLGSTTVEVADRVLEVLVETGEILKSG